MHTFICINTNTHIQEFGCLENINITVKESGIREITLHSKEINVLEVSFKNADSDNNPTLESISYNMKLTTVTFVFDGELPVGEAVLHCKFKGNYIYICGFLCVYIYIYVYTYVNIDIYLHIYTYTYTYIYIYVYKNKYSHLSGILNGDMNGFYKSNYSDADGNKKVMASTQFEVFMYVNVFTCIYIYIHRHVCPCIYIYE
jgi:hypothetical protein